ncbi:MAG: hypothetical protein U0869_07870 [Chloroflexota bacterium]
MRTREGEGVVTTGREGVDHPRRDGALAVGQLGNAVDRYRKLGYAVTKRTRTTAILTRPRQFSAVGFLLIGWWYLLLHRASSDETVYLSVDAAGKLTIRRART